jgi:predicted nucleic acid-binding protein
VTVSVVVDASAGVEIAAETSVGKALLRLVPRGARLYVPEHYYAECGAVLRKWANGKILPEARLAVAIDKLLALPLRRVATRDLFRAAWSHRHNVTFADGLYVALAERVSGSLLTGDHKLAATPTLRVPMLHRSSPGSGGSS